MTTKKKLLMALCAAALSAMLALAGCSSQTPQQQFESSGTQITVVDAQGEKTLSAADMLQQELTEATIHTENAIGEKSEFTVKGFDLKAMIGLQEGQSLKITAKDGYSVTLESDMLAQYQPLLAIERDGKALEEKNAPIMLVMDGAPSSYFIGGITKMEVVEGTQTPAGSAEIPETLTSFSVAVTGLGDGEMELSSEKLARNLTPTAMQVELKINGEMTKAVYFGYSLKDVLAFVHAENAKSVTFTAADGFSAVLSGEQLEQDILLTADMQVLEGDQANLVTASPLRIVSPTLTGKEMVSDIKTIAVELA